MEVYLCLILVDCSMTSLHLNSNVRYAVAEQGLMGCTVVRRELKMKLKMMILGMMKHFFQRIR
jgi:hypothetical protein